MDKLAKETYTLQLAQLRRVNEKYLTELERYSLMDLEEDALSSEKHLGDLLRRQIDLLSKVGEARSLIDGDIKMDNTYKLVDKRHAEYRDLYYKAESWEEANQIKYVLDVLALLKQDILEELRRDAIRRMEDAQ